MSEAKKDGGPAFPVSTASKGQDDCGPYGHQDSNTTWQFPGLTVRDYFAAKALVGLIAEPQWREGGYSLVYVLGSQTKDDAENYATAAYKLADAMLKARES